MWSQPKLTNTNLQQDKGHALVCVPAMLDGYVGAMLGINFPVYCRSAFGMRGSKFAVAVRGIVAVIWFGKSNRYCPNFDQL